MTPLDAFNNLLKIGEEPESLLACLDADIDYVLSKLPIDKWRDRDAILAELIVPKP